MNEQLEQSKRIVKQYMWWSTIAGLMPFPILDIASVTAVQLKMVSKLALHYNLPFEKNRVRAVITSLLSSISASAISKTVIISALKAVPILGSLTIPFVMPTFSGALTYMIGILFIQHFESGGTFLDFDPEKTKDYFEKQFDGKQK